ncbi:unnamed protein product [Notodromas monacha]|uniref:F-box domain-containing protein n=1 Tax=Notodromas monacha TaxID=399045 RepID=A0A7R9BID3_9CRUS|nr:unnamed protein product [Notodromas monacha]CAG0914673.1 unnamed protein product [Notodromas monacha]
MRAFLVKLHYGLRDLSYIELGECGSKQGSVHHHQGRTRKRRTTEFYVEWFDVDEHGLTCIPMQEDIRRSGAFVLEPDEKRDFRFDVTVKINREIVPSHLKRSVLLMHGDIIELFLQDIPYFRVMFLLTNEYSVRMPQTSVLLSCPWSVLQTIFRFLTPFEAMESIVPVCQQFFQLIRSGEIWTNLKVNIDFETYVPYGHLGDLCKVIAPLRTLHLIDIKKKSLHEVSPNVKFLDFLGSGELRSLHANTLPVELSNDDWLQAQRRGTFADLELLTLRGSEVEEMPLADTMCDAFPKLKSIWFQNVRVSPTNALDHILEMPSVEKLWFRNFRSEIVPEPISLHFFDRSPKEWLENIKLISADLWERYIPYSRMINLELVALFSRDKTTWVTNIDVDGTLPRSLENIFEELRNCSKLKGLILRIPDGFRCAVLGELSQELEFAAISGANIDEVKSVLECLFCAQTRLKELWIRVFNASKPAFEEIIEVLMRFKRLEEVLFVYTPCPPSKRSFDNDDDSDDALDSDYTMMEYPLRTFQRVMREFAHPGCCWKQATLLYDGPYIKEYFTYSFTLRMETEFSSFAVTKFFSDWFRHVMDGNGGSEFGAADLISALFPKQTE